MIEGDRASAGEDRSERVEQRCERMVCRALAGLSVGRGLKHEVELADRRLSVTGAEASDDEHLLPVSSSRGVDVGFDAEGGS